MKKTFFRKLILFKITLSWLVVICGSAESANLSDKQLINMARDEGVVFLMRHALAPGMGDPQNFDVNDCKRKDFCLKKADFRHEWLVKNFVKVD